MMVRIELRRLTSQWLDGSLMYPGTMRLTWVKMPFMPWMLASMEPHEKSQ